MTINDAMQAAFKVAGYTNLKDWLESWNDTGKPKHISDLWKLALVNLTGLPQDQYNFNDYYNAYLGQRGYAGTMNDRLLAFFEDAANGVIVLPDGGGVVPPIENGFTIGASEVEENGNQSIGFSLANNNFTAFGNLEPRDFLDTDAKISRIYFSYNGSGDFYFVGLDDPTGSVNDLLPKRGTVTLTVDGKSWNIDPTGSAFYLQSTDKESFDFMQARIGQTVDYSVEVAAPPVETGTFTVGQNPDDATMKGFAIDPTGESLLVFGDLSPNVFLGKAWIWMFIAIDSNGDYYASMINQLSENAGDVNITTNGIETTWIVAEQQGQYYYTIETQEQMKLTYDSWVVGESYDFKLDVAPLINNADIVLAVQSSVNYVYSKDGRIYSQAGTASNEVYDPLSGAEMTDMKADGSPRFLAAYFFGATLHDFYDNPQLRLKIEGGNTYIIPQYYWKENIDSFLFILYNSDVYAELKGKNNFTNATEKNMTFEIFDEANARGFYSPDYQTGSTTQFGCSKDNDFQYQFGDCDFSGMQLTGVSAEPVRLYHYIQGNTGSKNTVVYWGNNVTLPAIRSFSLGFENPENNKIVWIEMKAFSSSGALGISTGAYDLVKTATDNNATIYYQFLNLVIEPTGNKWLNNDNWDNNENWEL